MPGIGAEHSWSHACRNQLDPPKVTAADFARMTFQLSDTYPFDTSKPPSCAPLRRCRSSNMHALDVSLHCTFDLGTAIAVVCPWIVARSIRAPTKHMSHHGAIVPVWRAAIWRRCVSSPMIRCQLTGVCVDATLALRSF